MQQNREFRGDRGALCVLSCLLLLLGMLLGMLMGHHFTGSPLAQKKDTRRDAAAAQVPYDPHTVTAKRLDNRSHSVSGRLCGDEECSTRYAGNFNAVLVTGNKRTVLARKGESSLLVLSPSGEEAISVEDCVPSDLALLPSGAVAATCGLFSLVLISLERGNKARFQKIQTEAFYNHLAANPEDDDSLVVSSSLLETATIDVITLQGDLIRTLVSSSQGELRRITSLTVVNDHVLVTSHVQHLLRVSLTDDVQSGVEVLRHELINGPLSTAADALGNVFIAQINDVLLKTTDDRYRRVLSKQGYTLTWFDSIAVHEDRMIVVNDSVSSEACIVTEYVLVDG